MRFCFLVRATTALFAGVMAFCAHAARVEVENPAAPGPYAVARADYDFGDEVVALERQSVKSELRAAVHLPKGAPGPRPLVMFMHGAHGTCLDGDDLLDTVWPCPPGTRPVPSYLGYEGVATALASHGYAVVSVSANAVTATDQDLIFVGEDQHRATLALAHLDMLARAHRGQVPALAGLTGRLDLGRIGLMGHSRGGEGMARTVLVNALRERPYGIESLFLLAPADGLLGGIPDLPMAVLTSYCDGDVALSGWRYFDQSRHAFPDNVLRSAIVLMGANHNFYNTRWWPGAPGGLDDAGPEWADLGTGCAPEKRLSTQMQYDLGGAYIAGFFRLTMGGEKRFLPLFDGSPAAVRGLPLADARVTASFPSRSRLDLRNFDAADDARDSAGSGWLWDSNLPAYVATNCMDDLGDLWHAHEDAALCWPRQGGQQGLPVQALLLLSAPETTDMSAYRHLSLRLARVRGTRDLGLDVGVIRGPLGGTGSWQRLAGDPALALLPPVSSSHQQEGEAPRESAIRQQLTIPLAGFSAEALRHADSVAFAFWPSGTMEISDVALVTPAVGKGRPSRLPAIHIEDIDLAPFGRDRELLYSVRLSKPAEHPVSLDLALGASMRPLYFKPGEQAKTLRLRAKGRAQPQSCSIRARNARGAFSGREHARLRIRGEGEDAYGCPGFEFAQVPGGASPVLPMPVAVPVVDTPAGPWQPVPHR